MKVTSLFPSSPPRPLAHPRRTAPGDAPRPEVHRAPETHRARRRTASWKCPLSVLRADGGPQEAHRALTLSPTPAPAPAHWCLATAWVSVVMTDA
ncbi:hypothetical protein RKD26_003805 [Streptomyces calvus]